MASEDRKENVCSSSGKSTRGERKVVTDPAGTVSSILSERTIEGYSGTFTILSCGLPPSFSGKFSSPSRQSSGDKKENVSSSSGKSTRVKREVVTDPAVKGKVVPDPAVSSLPGAGTLGHQTPGSARSSGMGTAAVSTTRTVLPSGQSGLTSSATSVSLVGVGQLSANLAQNKLGSSTSTDFTGKHVVGGIGQQVPVMGREGVAAGSQIRQCEIGRNQNVLAGIGAVGPSSVGGSPVLGAAGSAPGNIQLQSTATVGEQPGATAADLHKVWEGLLRVQNPDMRRTHISISRLQAFCREASSINIAADWPPAMDIDKLVSPEKVQIENYRGKTVFLSFSPPDHHIALEMLAKRKLWALTVAIKHGQAKPIDDHGFPRSKATRTSFSCSRSTCSITTAYGKWPATTTTALAKPTTTINAFSNGTSIHSSVFNSTTTSAAKYTATRNASSNWTSFSPFSGTTPTANEFLLRDNISSKTYSQRECVWQLDKPFPTANWNASGNF